MNNKLMPVLLIFVIAASGCVDLNGARSDDKVLITGIDSQGPTVLYPGDSISMERSGLDVGCVAKNFNSFWTKNWKDKVEVGFSSTWTEEEVQYTYTPDVNYQIEYASHKIFFNSSEVVQRCGGK